MGPYDYKLIKIDGAYAILRRTDIENEEDLFIARALLPPEAEEGSCLRFENFSYTMLP